MITTPSESAQAPPPVLFRIFLASPGDVAHERQIAHEVMDQVRSERRFRDRMNIQLVAWDQPGAGVAMEADSKGSAGAEGLRPGRGGALVTHRHGAA